MFGMKESGKKWIGKIPADWKLLPIKYLFSVYAGGTPDSKNPDYWDGDVIWVTPADYKTQDKYVSQGRRNISSLGFSSCSTSLIPAGSIIFSKRAPIGTVAIARNELCTNQGCLSCVPRTKLSVDYFYYLMDAANEEFQLDGFGTTFKEISSSRFCNFILPCPSVEQQRTIADYLDSRCAKIDAIIDESKKSIEEYKELKQAVIYEAVTKGLDKHVEMKDSGVEWIGKVPATWKISRIATLYSESNETGNESLPILMVSINTGISDDEVGDNDRLRKVVRGDRSSYKLVKPNWLAYNMMRAWQGAFGAAKVEGMVSPAYVVAKPKVEINSKYIEYLLRTPNGTEEVNSRSYGIADFRKRLYWPYFKNIYVCLPPFEEQNEIVAYVDGKVNDIDSLISEKQSLVDDLEAYKKSLIYEVVTGKRRVV